MMHFVLFVFLSRASPLLHPGLEPGSFSHWSFKPSFKLLVSGQAETKSVDQLKLKPPPLVPIFSARANYLCSRSPIPCLHAGGIASNAS